MSRDKPIKKAFYTFEDGNYEGWFFPNMGTLRNYNVMRLLDKVKCKGAVGDAGKNGTTVIRVSQAVFNGKIGTAVSGKLKGLKERGCNIKLVYGVLNNNARQNLKNIPRKTILEDTNGDEYVDRYIHMKALTISGNFDGKRSSHIVYQGSANWSGMSTLSDEQGFIVRSQYAGGGLLRLHQLPLQEPAAAGPGPDQGDRAAPAAGLRPVRAGPRGDGHGQDEARLL